MNHRIKWSASVILALLLTGCGALFNGGPQMVQFTSRPDGAEVWVDGTPRGRTPISLGLSKNQNHTVVFRLAGHGDFGAEITRQISAGYVVLDVLGGVVPVLIDAATGSWYKLSVNTLHGSLNPVDSEDSGQLTPQQLTLLRLGVALDRILADAPPNSR